MRTKAEVGDIVRGIAEAIEADPKSVFGYVGKDPRRDAVGNVLLVLCENPMDDVVLTRASVASADGKCSAKLSEAACAAIARLFRDGPKAGPRKRAGVAAPRKR